MIRLEDIKTGLPLTGLEPVVVGSVVAVVAIAEGTVQVIYRTPDGALKDRLLNRLDETGLSVATTERPWSFEGDGEAFKLTVEATRIDLAFLFEPKRVFSTDPPYYDNISYRLYTLCERLGQAEDARAYNELITSWTGIESPPPARKRSSPIFLTANERQ